MRVLELFCAVDDFCQQFEPTWRQQSLTSGRRQRNRARQLALSEIMTIVIPFHQSHYRTFKAFSTEYVGVHLRSEFPTLVSYTRFVEFFPSMVLPLCVYLQTCFGRCSGISFIDSTALAVCHNRRITRHRVFRDLAARGKTSVGWVFGFSCTCSSMTVVNSSTSRSHLATLMIANPFQRWPNGCMANCLVTRAIYRNRWRRRCLSTSASTSSHHSAGI